MCKHKMRDDMLGEKPDTINVEYINKAYRAIKFDDNYDPEWSHKLIDSIWEEVLAYVSKPGPSSDGERFKESKRLSRAALRLLELNSTRWYA